MKRTTALGLLLLSLPIAGAGQELRLTPFAARNQALEGAPALVGLNLAWLPGAFGLRFGGAVDAPYSPVAEKLGYERSSTLTAWAADVDVVLSFEQAGIGLGRLGPSLFAGIGTHGFRRPDDTAVNMPVWSYGVGLARSLTSFLSLDGEARHRTRLTGGALLGEPGDGWEFRAGVSLRIRGTSRSHARGTRR